MEETKKMRIISPKASEVVERVKKVSGINFAGESLTSEEVCGKIANLKKGFIESSTDKKLAELLAAKQAADAAYKARVDELTTKCAPIQALNRALLTAVFASVNGADAIALLDGVKLFDSVPAIDTPNRLGSRYTAIAKAWNDRTKVTKKKTTKEEKRVEYERLMKEAAKLAKEYGL